MYQEGTSLQECLKSLLGTGVFNSDGDMWKFHRSMTRPFFSRDRISHFSTFGKNADRAIQIMKKRSAEGYAIDFQDAISRFTMDSATVCAFPKYDIRLHHSPIRNFCSIRMSTRSRLYCRTHITFLHTLLDLTHIHTRRKYLYVLLRKLSWVSLSLSRTRNPEIWFSRF